MAHIRESRSQIVGGVVGSLDVADINIIRDRIKQLVDDKTITDEKEIDLLNRLDMFLDASIQEATSVGKLF